MTRPLAVLRASALAALVPALLTLAGMGHPVFAAESEVEMEAAPAPNAPEAEAAADAGEAEAIAEAKALMQATNTMALTEQMFDIGVVQIGNLIKQLNPGQGEMVDQLMRDHFMPEFINSFGELEELYAKLYARHFTAQEMRELRAFYDTPLGRKTIEAMPALVAESARLGQAWGEEIARRALEKLKPALEEHGLQSPNI